MSLIYKQTDRAGCIVEDGGERIAEIHSLRLVFARFRKGGRALIGPTVPLPLYWMQYADHEHPDRNAGSHGRVTPQSERDDEIVIECKGTTASGSWSSVFVLTIRRSVGTYEYIVDAALQVMSDYTVTPNPFHGELEFANLWPEDVFVTDPKRSKRYRACIVDSPAGPLRIPHNHLESSDKHDVPLRRGDRFLWAPEDENLCLTVETDRSVTAGLCAYMWDAHFGYRICHERVPVVLPGGRSYHARYRLTDIGPEEAGNLLEGAQNRPAPGVLQIPIYVEGLNTFSRTISSPEDDAVWPWEQEGDARFSVDPNRGFDDSHSLRIDSSLSSTACWKATTLGPAYGKPAFRPGSRFRLSGYVATQNLGGNARIAIRLHREGHGSVFELNDYELFSSDSGATGTEDWKRLGVTSAPISPAPDRLHLLLIQQGKGTTWFDNILMEELR